MAFRAGRTQLESGPQLVKRPKYPNILCDGHERYTVSAAPWLPDVTIAI